MAIIVTTNGKNARRIDRSGFLDEKELQEYLIENPDVVPIYEIEEGIKLLILSREFSTNSGQIDALGIDQSGNLYIIETKLYKNPDKRLVIAQALDYGASMWAYFDDFSNFLTRLDVDVNKKFGLSLNQKLAEFFNFSEADIEKLIENMKQNLNKGIFKFVVLMDELEPKLKDLIRFINQNSQFDVYAVELEYYKFDKHEIMIPKLFGAEVKKDINVSRKSNNPWDEARFFSVFEKRENNKEDQIARKLYQWAKDKKLRIIWGSGAENGLFYGVLDIGDESNYTFGVWTGWVNGSIELPFARYIGLFADPMMRKELASRISNIIGEDIPQEKLSKYPGIKLSSLSDKQLDDFLSVYDWYLAQLKGS